MESDKDMLGKIAIIYFRWVAIVLFGWILIPALIFDRIDKHFKIDRYRGEE